MLKSLTALSSSNSANDVSNGLRSALKKNNILLSTLRNNKGETVLHLASNQNNLDVFNTIINATANTTDSWPLISAQTKDKATALHYLAKRKGSDRNIGAKMVTLLLTAAGENAPDYLMIPDHGDDTALQWAAINNDTTNDGTVINILNTTGADREALLFWLDDMKNTVLHAAANNRHIPLEIVKALVQAAGDRGSELIQVKGHNGRTALDCAKDQAGHRRNKNDIVNYFQEVLKNQ